MASCCETIPRVQSTAGTRNQTGCRPRGFARRFLGVLWPLVGSLGWLLVPKCPLCLMAYISMGTGITVSIAFSQFLQISLLVLAASLCVAGLWRIWKNTVSEVV